MMIMGGENSSERVIHSTAFRWKKEMENTSQTMPTELRDKRAFNEEKKNEEKRPFHKWFNLHRFVVVVWSVESGV